MVSKASDDFPEPESPVKTINFPLGRLTSTFFKLCVLAPRMSIDFIIFSIKYNGQPANIHPQSDTDQRHKKNKIKESQKEYFGFQGNKNN